MAEAVKVIVRCRPLNRREKDLNCGIVISMDDKCGQVALNKPGASSKEPPKSFTFDGAFYIDSVTETIYENIAFPLVEGVLEGYNGTVFAYGQTGCGKSFSMTGIEDPPTQRGIIPRAFKHIFEAVASNSDAKFLIHGSYLEIYNEEIRDLLGKDSKSKLELKEHPDKGVYVKDLTMLSVHSVAEIEHVMELGGKNRSVGSTLMNADSSRSHSIFAISLERCDTDAEGGAGLRAGKLNLVDLAGSERQAKTGATGDRLKEATKINLSLSALGNVISALVDGKAKHIPYRDSKLTRLLQDSLGGNTKTLMVACVSPADNNYDETLSTLRYANRAKNIKNKPKINEDPKDALLREFSDEISRLKALLSGQGIPEGLAPQQSGSGQRQVDTAELQAARDAAEAAKQEAEHIKHRYELQVQEMQASFQAAQKSNDELERNLSSLQREYHGKEEKAKRKVVRAESQVLELSPRHRAASTNEDSEEGGSMGPAALPSPQHNSLAGESPAATVPDQTAALQRLAALQRQLVGGERANDTELKKKLQKRRKHADTMKEKLKRSLAEDGELTVMERIYDNMQDALRGKSKELEKVTNQLQASQGEVQDLLEEFERDRSDYLDSIRELEKQLGLNRQILDTVAPCLRRDCNYVNLDWVKSMAIWNEELYVWRLPKLELVKTTLPNASTSGSMLGKSGGFGGHAGTGTYDSPPGVPRHSAPGMYEAFDEEPNTRSTRVLDLAVESDYFKLKRPGELLEEARRLRSIVDSPKTSSRSNGLPHPSQLPPMLMDLRSPPLGAESPGTLPKLHNPPRLPVRNEEDANDAALKEKLRGPLPPPRSRTLQPLNKHHRRT